MQRNQTKIIVLETLEHKPLTTKAIHDTIKENGHNLSLQSIRMCVNRCKEWNLVQASSRVAGSKEQLYAISEKGRRRLEWLKKSGNNKGFSRIVM